MRLRGDEFAVVREGVDGPWDALAAAQRLAAAWQAPFRVGDDEVFVTASTGIAAGRPGRTSADTLLREAAAALSRAKERGRGHAELYDEAMRERAHERLRLEADLRRAVEQGEIDVAYQPIVDMGTGRPVGVEALARWTHAERGPVSPSTFIAVAERSGLIGELGRDVLRTACAQAARWRAELPGGEDADDVRERLGAARSPSGELYGEVREALRDTGLPPHALTIEVTESALMEESDAPGAVLATLRTLGTQRRARRLRHGPLVAQLPAPLPDRRHQARPLVRRRLRAAGRGRGRRGDHPAGRLARAEPHRRGRRDHASRPTGCARCSAGSARATCSRGRSRRRTRRRCSPGGLADVTAAPAADTVR